MPDTFDLGSLSDALSTGPFQDENRALPSSEDQYLAQSQSGPFQNEDRSLPDSFNGSPVGGYGPDGYPVQSFTPPSGPSGPTLARPSGGALAYAGPAQDSQRAYNDASAYATQGGKDAGNTGGALSDPSVLSKIAKGLGLKGDIDNPKTMDSWMRFLMGSASALNSLFGKKNIGYKSPAELRSLVGSGPQAWTPQQQQWSDAYFNTSSPAGLARPRMYAADMTNSVTAPRAGPGYAHGGALALAGGGASPSGYIRASTGGQDDVVPINAAGGEFMFDADTVSALGDGNNEAGAAKLEELRRNIREHKRSAPATSIPPRASSVDSYLPKGALSHAKGAK